MSPRKRKPSGKPFPTETMVQMSAWQRVAAFEEPPEQQYVYILWNTGAKSLAITPAGVPVEAGAEIQDAGRVLAVRPIRRVSVGVLWNDGAQTLMFKQVDIPPEEATCMAQLALWWGTLQEPANA